MRLRIFLVCLSLAGCAEHPTKGARDLSAPDDDAGIPSDGGVDLLTLSPWGIDSRPSNTTCLAPARPVSVTNSNLGVQPMFPNLPFNNPIALYRNQLGPTDPMRWFVIERGGNVWTFIDPNASADGSNGTEKARQFMMIANVDQGGEGGLLSLAFDPQFPTNHLVYVSYTGTSPIAGCPKRAADWDCSQIARYTVTQNPDGSFTQSVEQSIFRIGQPYSNHNGGDMYFGPDGYLYLGFGDGGSGGDPQCSGQTLKSPLGKILRIDPRSQSSGYAIPPDNPFASPSPSPCIDFNLGTVRTANCPEVYAWGMRNPWRWSFDSVPPNGSGPGLWVGDVGQDLHEEVDFVEKGKNYGWNRKEGTYDYNQSCTPADTSYVMPLVEYDHNGIGRSISGGFVYRGSGIPALVGSYLFGDYGTGGIYVIPSIYNVTTTIQNPTPAYTLANSALVGFSEDEDHEVYAITFSTIYKIVAATPAMQESSFPMKLSQTGCVDPNDPTQPAAGLIPYDLNAPLWSDGASKRRWMALPDGMQITVGDGHWQLPIGSVLMKEFSLGGTRLETRLLVHHDDGDWAGYTYVWDDTGVDATLIDGRQQKVVGGQTWTFPSRADCLACHTTAAGRSLGPDTRQLNRAMIYPDGRYANILATLDHLGMFDAAIGNPSSLPAFPGYESPAPLEQRARSYLNANCAHCHQPGSTASNSAVADFRYDETLAQMMVCNVDPTQGSLGVANAKLLSPGDVADSLISVRMHATDTSRMPKIGSSVVDPTGTMIVDGWISSLTVCP
jgi:uncharacterized repeat protein (TIGR03806 family)